jgi:DNA polymerase V
LHHAKKNLTITGFRTVQELNGIAAIGKTEEAPRQAIMVSKSFQSPVYDIDGITAALAGHAQEAVKRMREGRLSCRYVSVYLMTNAYAEGGQYANQMTAELPYLSAYLPQITATANELLRRIYRPGYKFRKVMIGLSGLSGGSGQLDLYNELENYGKLKEPLMQAFDKINARYGRGAIKLCCGLAKKTGTADAASRPGDGLPAANGGQVSGQPWQTKRGYLSPLYTTNINDIPVAY